jgi:hypothetical protein
MTTNPLGFKPIALAIGILAAPLFADVQLITIQEDLLQKSAPQKIELWISADKLQVEMQGPQSMMMIYRQDKGLFWLIQPGQKSYTEMTNADIEAMAKTLEAARAKLNEQMKNLPEEQKQLMEKMMGGMLPPPTSPKVTFKKALGTAKVGEWSCQNWESYLDGVKNADHCVADFKATELKETDFKIFKDIAKFVGKMAASYKGLLDQSANLEQLGGIPVQTTVISDGKVESKLTLQSIKRLKASATTYELPAGLTKKSLPAVPTMPTE